MTGERKKNRRKMIERSAEFGFTIMEIMVVIIIIGMIATGVSIGVFHQLEKARDKDAKTGACTIRSAVQLFMAENPRKCPTIEDLKSGKYIDTKKKSADPWNQPYIIDCSGDDPDVYSKGEDGSGRIACEVEEEE